MLAPPVPPRPNNATATQASMAAQKLAAARSLEDDCNENVEAVTLPSSEFTILDLREIQTVRARIVGSGFWVTTQERAIYGGMEYLLIREPENKHDKNAVAIYGKGRKIGYVTTSKAAAMSALLKAMGYDRYPIGGAGVDQNSSRLCADLPSIPALRQFSKNYVTEPNANL